MEKECVFKGFMSKGDNGVDELIGLLPVGIGDAEKANITTFKLLNTNHVGEGRVCKVFSKQDGSCGMKTEFCLAVAMALKKTR